MRISDWSSDVCSSDLATRKGDPVAGMACNERGIRQWSSHKEFGYAERNRRATDLDRVSRRSRPFQSLAVRGGAQAAEPVKGRDAPQGPCAVRKRPWPVRARSEARPGRKGGVGSVY